MPHRLRSHVPSSGRRHVPRVCVARRGDCKAVVLFSFVYFLLFPIGGGAVEELKLSFPVVAYSRAPKEKGKYPAVNI